MVGFDWNLGDFENEVKKEHSHIADVSIEGKEKITNLLGGDLYEIKAFDAVGLRTDKVLALKVVVLAEKLQEFECSAISANTGL